MSSTNPLPLPSVESPLPLPPVSSDHGGRHRPNSLPQQAMLGTLQAPDSHLGGSELIHSSGGASSLAFDALLPPGELEFFGSSREDERQGFPGHRQPEVCALCSNWLTHSALWLRPWSDSVGWILSRHLTAYWGQQQAHSRALLTCSDL